MSPLPGLDADGAQFIRRTAIVIAAVAREGVDGMRLVDIARVTGIARPSVHRILQDLIAIDYVERHSDKHYAIGSALFTLGLAAPNPITNPILLRSLAAELAAETGDTVYVSIRHIDGVHYLMREHGPFPIRVGYIATGDIVAYTNTYSSVSLLALLPVSQREMALDQLEINASEGSLAALDPVGYRAKLIEKIADVRRDGYLWGSNFIIDGVAGIAAPVPSPTSVPYLAVSLSMVEARLPEGRIPSLAARVLETAEKMSAAIL